MAAKEKNTPPGITVDEFIKRSSHSLADSMEVLRKLILGTDKEITEHIKWNAPSFIYQGEDRITFNLSRPDVLLIIFHRGVKVKPIKGLSDKNLDKTGLLTWASPDRAVLTLKNPEEVKQKSAAIRALVEGWLKVSG